MYNEALISIEDICFMIYKVLSQLGIPAPNRQMHDAFNQELQCEKLYTRCIKGNNLNKCSAFEPTTKYVFDTLMKVVNDGTGGIYFLDAPGGTGNTFFLFH